MGSGSASRSVFDGFVEWHAGERDDGMDSYAEGLPGRWPDLCMGLLMLSEAEKPIGSRPAMQRTVETSRLYAGWPAKVSADLAELKAAIAEKDFEKLGQTAESNALAMHATMMDAWPPVLYWLPETVATIRNVWQLRAEGLPLYLTMDAGPNVKLLFLKGDVDKVRSAFPDVEVTAPFEEPT